ncbi:MAG: hypothetical protein PHF86_14930 [Candidatus Nanoarchaeia archaeon]|nr:hypothetical protein [Candidatus Nanoarchaeia archaeon]
METIKLTNDKVMEVATVLDALNVLNFDEKMYSDEKTSRTYWQKFVYAISRNTDSFGIVIKAIKKVLDPSKEYIEYDKKRFELAQKYADLDKDGKPVINGNSYIVRQNRDKFDREIDVLLKEYKTPIDNQNKLKDNMPQFLETEEEISCYKIKSEWVPLTLNAQQLRALLPLIDGEINQ